MDLTDDKSTLVQVLVWCRQVTSNYLTQCWPRSMTSCGVTRPQWNKGGRLFVRCLYEWQPNGINIKCYWIIPEIYGSNLTATCYLTTTKQRISISLRLRVCTANGNGIVHEDVSDGNNHRKKHISMTFVFYVQATNEKYVAYLCASIFTPTSELGSVNRDRVYGYQYFGLIFHWVCNTLCGFVCTAVNPFKPSCLIILLFFSRSIYSYAQIHLVHLLTIGCIWCEI